MYIPAAICVKNAFGLSTTLQRFKALPARSSAITMSFKHPLFTSSMTYHQLNHRFSTSLDAKRKHSKNSWTSGDRAALVGAKVEPTPAEMVEHLDNYIVSQDRAKRVMANALRNRWRRRQLEDMDLMRETHPRNILMVGPTGVGKTEIARTLAKYLDAPFLKVEATKYTEVGFHGSDVEQIVHDLVEVAIRKEMGRSKEDMSSAAARAADESILRAVFKRPLTKEEIERGIEDIRAGKYDNYSLSIIEHGGQNIRARTVARNMNLNSNSVTAKSSTPNSHFTGFKEARARLIDFELNKLPQRDVEERALASVEQEGIVFIDEIDKICTSADQIGASAGGMDVSSVGVQRDLLPLIEGCTIETKYGNVSTDNILFIASGAFHAAKPSDLLPELRGRLPVRIDLTELDEKALYQVLTEPRYNILRQQAALFEAEGVEMTFGDDAVKAIARVAANTNQYVENLGARRLHTVVEKVLEDLSFEAPQMANGQRLLITSEMVENTTKELGEKEDYRKSIL